jgi:hypothetical protein
MKKKIEFNYTPPPPLLIIKVGEVYYRRLQPVPYVNGNKFENLKKWKINDIQRSLSKL